MSSNQTTNQRGNIAVAKTINFFIQNGYYVFRDIVSDTLPFDLIAYNHSLQKSYRIQVKYATRGKVRNYRQSCREKKFYQSTDFDCFAIYLPEVDQLIFVKPLETTKLIRFAYPKSAQKFYWFEDYKTFPATDYRLRSYKDLGIESKDLTSIKNLKSNNNLNKIAWPDDETLKTLIWSKPIVHVAKDLNVSDAAIIKRCKIRNIERPKRGHWIKNWSGLQV